VNGYCNRHYLTKGSNGAKATVENVTPEPLAVMWAWQKWDKPLTGGRGQTSQPTITITDKGLLIVSSSADTMLGMPETVDVMVVDKPRAIGFKAAGAEGMLAPKRKQGKAGFSASAALFLSHMGIDYSETRRWRAQLIDGVLAINLEEAPVRAMGRKAGTA